MGTTIIHSMQDTYADAISLAEKQLEEANSKLQNLERQQALPNSSKAVEEQRLVVGALKNNLLDMRGSYLTLFGTLPPLP